MMSLVRLSESSTRFPASASLNNAATEAVMLTLAGKPTFPTGGQIAVLSGVTGISGLELGGNTVFTISANGRNIAPS
jgi:hypothetical protein